MDIEKIIGKRLKSNKPIKMIPRFPGNDRKITLPSGKPSPKIKSYIKRPGGVIYYAVKGTETADYYIKKEPHVRIVSADAKDNSSWWGGWSYWFSDTVENATDEVKDNAGYLSEGFQDSVSNVGGDMFSAIKYIKWGGIGLAVILLLYFLIQITD